jgi:hypothetical protein
MDTQLSKKIQLYFIAAIFSMMFALAGFSYNVWRMEVTEENSNIRMACFEILLELSDLEQLIYTAHYDHDLKEGSPRKGWVKVGLIVDLSVLADEAVEKSALELKDIWSGKWSTMADNRQSVNKLIEAIDAVRAEIKTVLRSLR